MNKKIVKMTTVSISDQIISIILLMLVHINLKNSYKYGNNKETNFILGIKTVNLTSTYSTPPLWPKATLIKRRVTGRAIETAVVTAISETFTRVIPRIPFLNLVARAAKTKWNEIRATRFGI